MTTGSPSLDAIRQQHQEWSPWLAVVEQALGEIDAAEWSSAIAVERRDESTIESAAPLLDGVTFAVQRRRVSRLLGRLIARAAASGIPKLATLSSILDDESELLPLLLGTLRHDPGYVERVAASRGADVDAAQAVIALCAVPLLHACRRRFERAVSKNWSQPYCPVCGSWPVFAEERGIERTRCFRCGRCGGEWHARTLRCAYCNATNHKALTMLVPEGGRSQGVIEGCGECCGYIKVLTRLQGCAPASVLVEDLATVALDLAARSAGYVRPAGPGYPLAINVRERHASWLFEWK
jgi:FdhE protein